MKEEKKMNNEENLKNTRHYFDEIITSPQPSPRGEGVVVGEVTNHTNTGEVTRKVAHSYGFSLLEKALRSNPLTALLRSRLSRFSLPERRFACSSAFSLAETMVVMIIVAIILAAAAPLIAKKMTNNDRYIYSSNNGTDIRTAVGTVPEPNGGPRILNVGNPVPNDMLGPDYAPYLAGLPEKLTVNGNAEFYKGSIYSNIKNSTGNNGGNEPWRYAITNDGIKVVKRVNNDNLKLPENNKPENSYDNYHDIFTINPQTGETNLQSAIPDYANISAPAQENTLMRTPKDANNINNLDGYLYISNALGGYTITEGNTCNGAVDFRTNGAVINNINMQTVQNSLMVSVQRGPNPDERITEYYSLITRLPLLVPISKNQCFRCTNNVFRVQVPTATGTGIAGGNYQIPVGSSSGNENKCAFIPLKKVMVPQTPHP